MLVSSVLLPLLLSGSPLDARVTRAWSDQEVENRLRSTEAIDVAWAAHEAGSRRLERTVPALLDVLESPPEDAERGLALEHALDALILLGAELEPRHISHIDRDDRVQRTALLVLAARSPARFEPVLIDLLDREPKGIDFHAVVSLLSEIRSRSVAARLLRRLESKLSVTVLDPMTLVGYMVSGCGGFGLSGRSSHASSWPPAFDYDLVFTDLPWDDELPRTHSFELVSVPRPIVARRRARSPRRVHSGRAPSQADLVLHLVHLAGLPAGSVKIPAEHRVNVSFESAAQVRAFVESERNAIVAEHERLRQTLATQALLDRAQWHETSLKLEVEVEDGRSDKSIPLE